MVASTVTKSPFASTGWSRPFVHVSWYGSTLIARIGFALTTAFTVSRVGPHSALLQNAGVANARTNGSPALSAWSTDSV